MTEEERITTERGERIEESVGRPPLEDTGPVSSNLSPLRGGGSVRWMMVFLAVGLAGFPGARP
jgi:hypothetical protein